jgi:hypothetical protein
VGLQELPDPWALEVTREFAPLVRPRLLTLAKKRGLNMLVLDHNLSYEQKLRVRFVARRFGLGAVQLRRRACKREVASCAVVARTPAAVEQLARRRHVDIVVLRIHGPKAVPGLAGKYVRAASGTASARLLLVPTLGPRFARAPWRRATSAVADVPSVDLGVRPNGRSSRRAVRLFLGVVTVRRPPQPTLPGALVFKGDFETGNPSQWTWGAQCANTGVPSDGSFARGTITVQSGIVAQGRYAARFDLPAATTPSACEVLRKRTLKLDDEWYGLEFRFPPNWREPSSTGWGAVIAQLNYQKIWGAPVALWAHADRVRLVLNSGLCRPVGTPYPPGPGCANNSGPTGNLAPMYVIPNGLKLGVWHQVLVHVRWTKTNSGLLQVFHRKRRESAWQLKVNFSGKPTVQWTTTLPADPANWTADKIGAYRGQSTVPLSVWHDAFCVATTRAAVESCL